MTVKKKKKPQARPQKPLDIETVKVDQDRFDAAIDRLLKADPTPQKKVKGNKARVPEPIFPEKKRPI